MHYTVKDDLKKINKWGRSSAAFLGVRAAFVLSLAALTACGTTALPEAAALETAAPQRYDYSLNVQINPGDTQRETEARYRGDAVVWLPEAGFAVLGIKADENNLNLLDLGADLNKNAVGTPEVTASGYTAWSGGYTAWSGGYTAWSGGYTAWSGGYTAWSGGYTAWSGGKQVPSSTFGENLTLWNQIKLPQGQRLAPKLGGGVKVAVIDTGVALEHPALAGHLAPSSEWKDFVDGDAYPNDTEGAGSNASFGHGTAVAGIILQVAPQATILPIRVLAPDGQGDVTNVVAGIDWAIQRGADVINLSLGASESVASLQAMMSYAASRGVFVVASAGNDNRLGLSYPANWARDDGSTVGKYLLSVGSVDKKNKKSPFSNYGPQLELVAPGESVYTAMGKGKGAATGTSFAAPLVSGSLALAVAERPTSRGVMHDRLTASSTNVDLLNLLFRGGLGYGRLDVEAFLKGLDLQEPAPTKNALYVLDTANANSAEGDAPFIKRLQLLGFGVTIVDDNAASVADARGKDLVVISSSVNSGTLNSRFRDLTTPVVTWEEQLYSSMRMTSVAGSDDGQTHVRSTLDTADLQVFESPNKIAWGRPSASAIVRATLPYDASKAAVFGYEKGTEMVGMTAPARRVGLFQNYYGAELTPNSWFLFDGAVMWAASPPAQGVLREWWTGVGGVNVGNLTGSAAYKGAPTGTALESSFEAPSNWADNYGTRMRGYLYPPVSGTYRFWIAGDDNAELYLGVSSDPATARRVAYVPDWSNAREWDKFVNQASGGIYLEAGKAYYIEALQKEGAGGDNLAVAWTIPGGSRNVISAQYLAPTGF